jgi:2-amino-4-hydroxy-6-hydroxymethyldihydropteridine diphosphokinase
MMTSVVLLLGSNDHAASVIVDRAVTILGASVGDIVKVSGEYISAPYGFSHANNFINRAVEIATTLNAYELLRRINLIEALLGRDREEERRISAARGEQYASRPIDIDIVFYGDETYDDDRLTIPYHYLDIREYALRPVAEVAATRRHPALASTPEEMLKRISNK